MLAASDRCEALLSYGWWLTRGLPRRCPHANSTLRQGALVCGRHAALVDRGGLLLRSAYGVRAFSVGSPRHTGAAHRGRRSPRREERIVHV